MNVKETHVQKPSSVPERGKVASVGSGHEGIGGTASACEEGVNDAGSDAGKRKYRRRQFGSKFLLVRMKF